ncbi:MAG: nitroreductase family protein [Acidobacteria bacterium]|nr:nitroreductase family protein [Acidobacteriota bacterium]NIM64004.1 nitroreductase family protein [Acidobacteriota bacterium]NIO60210.1 nitroreductase family protein [Acidobacteriota bacterium]NIQ31272.1 nitroreductase family protein [Acidobacteriota bacterium]NIQ86420.1 nitroreductase family protein [Acidobacteriota bacterium]
MSSTEYPFVPLEFSTYAEDEMLTRANEFYRDLSRRRSVRDYDDRAVPKEIVERAILTAGTAPSGAHKQPWTFVLVGDRDIKAKIREAAEIEEKENYTRRMPESWLKDLAPLGTDEHKPFLTTCPWLIVIFAQLWGRDEDGEKAKHYYVNESVGIATGMLLAALHRAGLATLTHTPSPMGFLHRILERPENERAYMLIALGYPKEGCTVPDLQRKSLEQIAVEV